MIKFLEKLFKKENPVKKDNRHTGCNFGIKEFNTKKRTKAFVEEINTLSKRSNKGKGGKNPIDPPPSTVKVIFLDFDGHTVTGTSWNYNGEIVCNYSGLTEQEKEVIVDSVTEDFYSFDVIVTTDETVFNSANMNSRIRCIITETWEWYGMAGGVAFVSSFTWNDDTPCFVFSSLLGYNTKYIQEAISHEVGHTLGLYHQSRYDENCIKLSDYNTGCCGEAPIMGVAYYQPIGKWWVGPNSYGCNSIQNDINIITNVLGVKR